MKPLNPKGNQSWIFIGMTDIAAETPILWPPDAKNWLIGKDPDAAGKDSRQEEKGTTEDEMASSTRWTWVWASSRSWWKSGKPGMSQSMGSQRVGHHWTTELKWLTDLKNKGWKLTLSLEYGTTTRFHGSLLTLFFGYIWKVIKRIHLAVEWRRRIGNQVFMLLYFLTETLQGQSSPLLLSSH